ncbi:MAG TPA: glycosyltransferase [Candidatus Avimonas sp.]|mgnify:FL=1|nr:glycosyltransferase [Candidatus Avimonas sp.]
MGSVLKVGKIGICGHFNLNGEAVGGQTIKTRIIGETLSGIYGLEQVKRLDTAGWRKKAPVFLIQCVKLACQSEHIVILPAHRGVKVLVPLFVFLSRLFGRKLHYVVVGAWLADLLKGSRLLTKIMKKVDFIYPQTNTLIEKLNKIGIAGNLYLMPNFKAVPPLNLDFDGIAFEKPYKLCMMSRINCQKGVEAAVEAVRRLNIKHGKKTAVLDIYGPVEDGYKERFEELLSSNSEYVRHRGTVDYNHAVNVLKDYYLLLFPTKYFTEGFPGTILDGYLSGVPVLASKWESWQDIIEDKRTGYVYEFDDDHDFFTKLDFLIQNPDTVLLMKKNCLKEAQKYSPDRAVKVLADNIS